VFSFFMKDMEIARHPLDKIKMHEIKNPNEGIIPMYVIQENDILALEWLEDDAEAKKLPGGIKKNKKTESPTRNSS
jgi:hypothetical protein